MNDRTVGVGIIGAGQMGSQHAWNLNRISQVAIVGIADVDLDAAQSLGHHVGGAQAFADSLELIADPRVEGVVIASPAATHPALAIEAIAMGKRVLCEKPLALTEKAALDVVQAELTAGERLLQMGFMREFDPAHMALRRRVGSGEIGRPVLFRGRHTMSVAEPAGEAAFSLEIMVVESAIHDLHSSRFLTGRDISEVFMHVLLEDDSAGSPRAVSILLRLGEGSAGHLAVGSLGGGYHVGAEVLGETGWAHLDDKAENDDDHPPVDPDPKDRAPWFERFREAYRREAEAWVHGIRTHNMPEPHAWDGYLANKAAAACFESTRIEGPVTLDPTPTPRLYQAKPS